MVPKIKNLNPDSKRDIGLGLKVFTIGNKEIERNSDNWFRLIAFANPEVRKIWETIITKGADKLSKFSKNIHDNECILRGIEMGGKATVSAYTTFIVSDFKRAIKSGDVWSVKEEKTNEITAFNSISKEVIRIPKRSLTNGLRRISFIEKIDLSKNMDYIVCADFPDSQKFFKTSTNIKSSLAKWSDYLDTRKTYFVINRRFNLAASHTHLVAFASSHEFTPSKLFWAVKDVSLQDAKILSLWLNSTFHLIQLLYDRVETGGAYLEVSGYSIPNYDTLDLGKLSSKDKTFLLNTFDNIKDMNFPSIIDQFKNNYEGRKIIDTAILKVLGLEEMEQTLLNKIYPQMAAEIGTLKGIMEGR